MNTDYQSIRETLDEEAQYALDERAAILEYEAKMSREDAEAQAVELHKGNTYVTERAAN